MQILTETCKVTVSDNGEIQVDHREELRVKITTNSGVSMSPAGSVFRGMDDFHQRNWWVANYGGNYWNLDLEAGCSRFNGMTTTRRINEALRVAGVEEKDIRAIVRLAKKHQHRSVARHY
jgi:hypothetical protein